MNSSPRKIYQERLRLRRMVPHQDEGERSKSTMKQHDFVVAGGGGPGVATVAFGAGFDTYSG